MHNDRRLTIGVLSGYQVYGNMSDSQTIEGNSISDYLLRAHQGILRASKALDCNILIGCGLGSPPIPEHPFPAWFNWSDDATFVPVGPWNTDGLIVLTPVISEQRQKLLRELRDGGFPVVSCGTGDAPAVILDNADGIRSAVRHLYEHGHRYIAYIAGYEHGQGDSAIRFQAYLAAMRELRLGERPELIVYGYHTIRGGKVAMQKLLASGQKFSALVTSDYSSALGALRVLHEAGLNVPQDVALIGFDDYLDAQAQIPPMTTVHMQWAEMGYQSVQLLLDYIHKQRNEPVTLSVQGQLVIRSSCGCMPERLRANVESALLADDEIIRRMAEVALRGAYHLQLDETQARFAELMRAYRTSLRESDGTSFFTTLNELLDWVAERDDDVNILQDVITVLRQTANVDVDSTAEALLAEASLRVSEFVQTQSVRRMIHKAHMSEELGAMTSRLLFTLDEAEIPKILAEHLPRLNIGHAEIISLERDEEDAAAWSLPWGQEQAAGSLKRRFPTRQFPPRGLYPAERAYQSIMLPLLRQHEQVGYIAFATDDLEPLGAIAQHVSAAIASAQLYKEAQEGRQMAENANQLKTRFLSTVSHELRMPLNLVVGLSELLLREQGQGKQPARQDLERIYASSRHLGFLIRDVLDLASSNAGQLRLALEPLNLNDVLRAVCTTGEQLTAEKGLAWNATCLESDVRILGDRVRLQQVLLNLISNAVKFTAKGSVTLTAVMAGTQVEVAVKDTGLGIPLEEQGIIFDEFRQSERTATRGYGGMGLGLAISRQLVKLHGGEIGVQSSGVEGEGSTLFFTLPVLEQSASRLPVLQYSDVVVVTDQTQQADTLREYLAEQGYNAAIHALDEEMSWLAEIASKPPAAVLLDQSLVVKHGWGALDGLRSNPSLKNIPVLMYALPKGDQTGAVFELDYQSKPLSLESLPVVLARAPQTILLVDDDQQILDLHTRMIQAQLPDCRVIHAHNGRDAVEILSSLHPDLILLDLMMPELDGFGVLKALQADGAKRKIPVVVMTNKVLTEQDMEHLNQGVATVLEKGIFTSEETLTRITAALNQNIRASNSSQQIVRRAMAYIHTHYAEPLNRDVLAEHLSVSQNYLTNCFQKEIGVSPLAYANRYRIHRARSLLNETNQTVTEIAIAVGFADLAHFSRVFRKETGTSPIAYRHASSHPKPE
jgi:signal transduction histidine kinase/DNA-binding response OmpR family regulator/ABC-type sugar transport system substrate-binding protein